MNNTWFVLEVFNVHNTRCATSSVCQREKKHRRPSHAPNPAPRFPNSNPQTQNPSFLLRSPWSPNPNFLLPSPCTPACLHLDAKPFLRRAPRFRVALADAAGPGPGCCCGEPEWDPRGSWTFPRTPTPPRARRCQLTTRPRKTRSCPCPQPQGTQRKPAPSLPILSSFLETANRYLKPPCVVLVAYSLDIGYAHWLIAGWRVAFVAE